VSRAQTRVTKSTKRTGTSAKPRSGRPVEG